MIKGINRRVIVVKSPDQRFFEEAIFIVREGVTGEKGVTAEQVVAEARQVAETCARKAGRRRYWNVSAVGYMGLGALLATVLWCIGLAIS